MWVAQLTEPIVEIRRGVFNVDRPQCRYFVPTEQLAAFPHALDWWGQRGPQMRLADEPAAIARAAASDGVHFSFEKKDRGTRTAICGRFEPASLSEHVNFRSELVSFALTELALADAREEVSAGPAEPTADEASAESIDAAASELATREAASAAASDLRAAKVAKKRLEGKEREQQQKKEKASKKQKA